MVTVGDVLKYKPGPVYRIEVDASVLNAARTMNDHHIGGLVVTRGDEVIGIFTERDVLTRIVAAQRDPSSTPVKDVMSSPVACCTTSTTLEECRTVMTEKRIRHIPVVDDNRLVGMISIGDILAKRNADQQDTIRYLQDYLYGNTW